MASHAAGHSSSSANIGNAGASGCTQAGLIMDDAGDLYGTTLAGGIHYGDVVFELVKSS